MLLHLVGRLLSQLNRRAELIAVAMQSRGFAGPEKHQVQLGMPSQASLAGDVASLFILAGLLTAAMKVL